MASGRQLTGNRPSVSAVLPPVSREQVTLRKELKRLTGERDHLKSLLRQRAQSHQRSSNLETDREYSELSQEIVAMRSELTLLLLSDNALHREELQEEAKVLYQEWRRLQDSAFEKQIAISDAKKELDDALDEEGAVMYDRQAKQIVELSEKLARYEHANRKLAHKIKKLKAEREQAVVGGGRQEIARQIENVEKETLDIEERIRSAKENHQKVMSSLRASLRAAGVAQEDTT